MSKAIAEITQTMKEQDAAPARDYWQEIRKLAGDDPAADPAKLAAARRELGLTAEQVEADLRTVAERFKLRAKTQGQADLEARLADLRKQRDKADGVLAAAEKRHDETCGPIDFEADDARRRLREIEQAEKDLAERCPYPDLAERQAELRQAFGAAHREAGKLKAAIADLEPHIEYLRRQARGDAPLSEEQEFELAGAGPGGVSLDQRTLRARQKLSDLADKREARLAPMREALAGWLADAERIGKAQADLRRAMIEP